MYMIAEHKSRKFSRAAHGEPSSFSVYSTTVDISSFVPQALTSEPPWAVCGLLY
jgi:hypothetical protein